MTNHLPTTHEKLTDLAALADQTERTERRILEQAEKRLQEVQEAIDQATPGVEGQDGEAQQQYLDLLAERGHLHMVIAKARKVLSS
jgi:division protein CdvB (Snf7/Vps24/ESCRT-III family)